MKARNFVKVVREDDNYFAVTDDGERAQLGAISYRPEVVEDCVPCSWCRDLGESSD
jgi:hypothetical protein